MHNAVQSAFHACINTPFFGVVTCIVFYAVGVWIQQKGKLKLLNPLLTSTILVMLFLRLCHIPYAYFKTGADILQAFLGPVTAILAIAMYNQRKVLLENIVPLLAGTIAGAVASVAAVIVLGNLFHLDATVIRSMTPKSVTTPIALSLSKGIGGILPLTMLSVICSGLTGGIFAPKLVKLFHVTHAEAAGIAIGTCSHAIGTSAALEMGEVYGAMSSVAIGCMGLATTVVFMLMG